MKAILNTLLLSILLSVSLQGFSQKNRLSIGTQIPMNYSIAYEEYLLKGIYTNYHFGYLTDPYVKVLFHEAEKRGLNPEFSELIEDYFKRGISHQVQLKYAPSYAKGFYISGLYKEKNLLAVGIPFETAAGYFDIPLTDQVLALVQSGVIKDLDFRSNMLIPGVLIGKTFKLGKSRWSMYLEASFMKIVNSFSEATFTGTDITEPTANDLLNKEIRTALNDDGDLYTFNVGFSYTFPVSLRSLILSPFKKEAKDLPASPSSPNF